MNCIATFVHSIQIVGWKIKANIVHCLNNLVFQARIWQESEIIIYRKNKLVKLWFLELFRALLVLFSLPHCVLTSAQSVRSNNTKHNEGQWPVMDLATVLCSPLHQFNH